ncbi:hypothetical protein HYW32_02925 [Candidatus Berkelbacteria bacterium]|nr:hypothetical protein [Candidatus Berkelbacteria bacterium]
MPSMGLRRDYTQAPLQEIESYLVGASHDGTWNQRHKTFRYTQRERSWLELVQRLLGSLNRRSWLYREGQQRTVWALETTYCPSGDSWHLLPHSQIEWIGYIRGFFDAEGGLPKNATSRFYLQFVQKNRRKLDIIRSTLEELDIPCGALHIPSKRVDPNYWRFFVSTRSHRKFADVIGSWHPRKSYILSGRMKI